MKNSVYFFFNSKKCIAFDRRHEKGYDGYDSGQYVHERSIGVRQWVVCIEEACRSLGLGSMCK